MRAGLTAAAALTVERAGERQRIRWSHAWPVVLRPTGDEQVHLVHGAGGPLGGDAFSLAVDIDAGAGLRVRSAGATLVQPGAVDEQASWTTVLTVGAGGWLDWAPEPTIVADGAGFVASARVDVAAGGRALIREVVVLGRYGGRGGRYRGELSVTVGGVPLLAHTTLLDGADTALCGPAGTAGARAIGTLLVVGPESGPGCPEGTGERPGLRWAWSALDGPGSLLLAVGEPGQVSALLAEAATSVSAALTPQPA